MDTKGGRVSLTIDGVTYHARGAAKINPSLVSLENGANMDGSGYSTVKPELASIELSLDRGSTSIKWTEDMLLSKVNVTFKEDDYGVTHLFTAARWGGKPEIDTATGEVSGLKLESDQYQRYA
ncbi:Phage tail tube protein [Faunimonas pinastri]|uniref:Phage tail tube protein n=1 Tax=Faunimonas pinastri TaxID=1855383 RepID=A0A1H9GEN1_9HYPH|nr:phage tail tube protein [Faunimonas pinastri]SEQ48561.1 Phage tail tube protein [Faunimonas pinastri]